MEEKEVFKMTYSAKQQEEVAAIRKKYAPQEPKEDKMEQLRRLDAQAGKKATAYAIALGVVGTLVLGIGMSLIMSDLGALLGALALPVGILLGVIGIVPIILAYPVYQRTLKKEQKKVAPEILRLTDELLK